MPIDWYQVKLIVREYILFSMKCCLLLSSIALAFFFECLPLSQAVRVYLPLFMPLILLIWACILPPDVMVSLACLIGLIMDHFYRIYLGIHAFIFILMSYLVSLETMPLKLSQAISVFGLLITYQIVLGMIYSTSIDSFTQWVLGPSFLSALLWYFLTPLFSSMYQAFDSERDLLHWML